MKLLIVTQAVDEKEPILGFFVSWIREFAKHFETVHVICLKKGSYELPSNVHVHSLGKEEGKGRMVYLYRLYRYVVKYRHEYDSVFVHMNPEYLVLVGWLWRQLRKKVGLWYVHRSVNLWLRLGVIYTNHIFTASKESFRLQSPKVIITGHAIDTDRFKPKEDVVPNEPPVLCTIGRLSPYKRIEVMLEAVKLLTEEGVRVRFTIAGVAGEAAQVPYAEGLKNYVIENHLESVVTFLGAQDHSAMPELLRGSDIFLNLSETGSMDKAVLEAMASGVPTIVSNEAFEAMIDGYKSILFTTPEATSVKKAIKTVLARDTEEMRGHFRSMVVRDHSFHSTIRKITETLQ